VGAHENRALASVECRIESLEPIDSDRVDAGEVVNLRPDGRKVELPNGLQVAACDASQLSPAGRLAEMGLERLHEPRPMPGRE
jgi:hypothetical protein